MFYSHDRKAFRMMTVLASAIGAAALNDTTMAGVEVLGNSGWQARWDNSLNGRVDIDHIDVVGDTVFLQKSAEFTQPPSNGVFAPIVVTFEQIGASTISHFVIDDEIIANSTGATWTGFMMKANNNPNVHFNPAATLASGGGGPVGFSIDPFTTAQFESEDKVLHIGGGLLAPGDLWYPGGSANDGQLWIDVLSGGAGNLQSFNLTEKPLAVAVPGPSALVAMLGLIGLPGIRRRRGR